MALGDSNTRGFHGDNVDEKGAYRIVFSQLLDEAGIEHDMIGQYSFSPVDPTLDPHHQGVGGYKIQDMTANHATAIHLFQPDFILLLAGTNNHYDDLNYNEFHQKYDDLLGMIKTQSPNTQVIMATVPKIGCCRSDRPQWDEAWVEQRNTVIFPFINSVLIDVAGDYDNVSVVDFFPIMDEHTDLTLDQIHMNKSGHEKLGQLFFDEFTAVPEPASGLAILAVGIVALTRRKR